MKPITDMEFAELLQKAYPEYFSEYVEEKWWDFFNEAQEFLNRVNKLCSSDERTEFFKLDDFILRLIKLTTPDKSPLTNKRYHRLGESTYSGRFMSVIVEREFEPQNGERENEM